MASVPLLYSLLPSSSCLSINVQGQQVQIANVWRFDSTTAQRMPFEQVHRMQSAVQVDRKSHLVPSSGMFSPHTPAIDFSHYFPESRSRVWDASHELLFGTRLTLKTVHLNPCASFRFCDMMSLGLMVLFLSNRSTQILDCMKFK